MQTVGHRKADEILVIFQILEGVWPLKPRGLYTTGTRQLSQIYLYIQQSP